MLTRDAYDYYACPYSDTTHAFVSDYHQQNVDDFCAWCQSIIEDLDNGGEVSVVLDCEGDNLGFYETGTLRLIQIAEVSLQNMKTYDGNDSLDVYGGFLVSFPDTPEEALLNLCSVLSHPRTTILTCDFTCDIAALDRELFQPLENRRNVSVPGYTPSTVECPWHVNRLLLLDAQMYSVSRSWNPLMCTRVHGLLSMACESDPSLLEGRSEMKEEVHVRFSFCSFLHPDEFWEHWLNHSTLMYSAGDLYLTATAMRTVFHHVRYPALRAASATKIAYMDNLPSINEAVHIRHGAFFRAFHLSTAKKVARRETMVSLRSIQDVASAISLLAEAKKCLGNEDYAGYCGLKLEYAAAIVDIIDPLVSRERDLIRNTFLRECMYGEERFKEFASKFPDLYPEYAERDNQSKEDGSQHTALSSLVPVATQRPRQ